MENFQIDMNRLGEWALENEMIINQTKSKTVCFTKARVIEPLNFFFTGHSSSGSEQL
jgi:hypothetical protein